MIDWRGVFAPGGYHGSSDFLPEVRRVACQRWTRHQPQGLGRHRHPDHWEVHYLVDGRLEWWLAGRRHHLRTGDAFVVRPGQVHSGIDSVSHRSTVAWFSFALATRGGCLDLAARPSSALRQALEGLGRACFAVGDDVAAAFAALLAEGRRADRSQPAARAAAVRLLHCLIRDAGRTPVRTGEEGDPDLVDAAIARIVRCLDAPPAVSALARDLGVGRTTLYHAFLRVTGLSPKEYELQLRLQHGRELVADGRSLAEAARACGFASAQAYGTAFKRAFGLTPGTWRQRLQARAVAEDGMPALPGD